MRTDHPDDAELRRNFDEGLAWALAGRRPRSGTGLDLPTTQALRAVASACPRTAGERAAAARAAFAGQLDGFNAVAARYALRRRFAETRPDATQSREGRDGG